MKRQKRNKTLFKLCVICDSLFERPYKMTLGLWDKRKCCSQKCNGINKRGMESLKHRKGKPAWNRGMKMSYLVGNKHAKGYKHTDDAKRRMSLKKSNEKHWAWKGDKASYSAIHKWMINKFGKANKCQNLGCAGQSIFFDWALLHERKYVHERENFIELCRICHNNYDNNRIKLLL